MIDPRANQFGLPHSLIVPIAAQSLNAIQKYVGLVIDRITGRSGRLNAIMVIPHSWPVQTESIVPLWDHPDAHKYMMLLHPMKQIWVHVDYSGYRKAYIKMGMPIIPEGYVLDHIKNREAIRLRYYSHPYLRLCPVSSLVNTNSGTNTGGEGMEKEHLRTLDSQPESVRTIVRKAFKCDIVYADPVDLTKMLNIPPGSQILDGVREMLQLFYPE